MNEIFCPEYRNLFLYGTWVLVHNKKVTRQQFYGMLTGSVIIDSVQTDYNHFLTQS